MNELRLCAVIPQQAPPSAFATLALLAFADEGAPPGGKTYRITPAGLAAGALTL